MKPVFTLWQNYCESVNSAHVFKSPRGRECMPENDQCGFAKAIADSGTCPFVLPQNWNFRQTWHRAVFGPIKIWHDVRDVSEDVLAWNARHSLPGATIDFGVIAA
jgi:hypothetical protein